MEQEACAVNVELLCVTDGDRDGETLRVTIEVRPLSVERV